MQCKHCNRYYNSDRVAALGTEPGYCQPSCTKRAIDAAGAAFAAWFGSNKRAAKK